jgi:carboxylesterase
MKSGAIAYSGGGPHAILLLHGLASTPLELRFLAKALHQEGFSVFAPLLDGYSAGTAPADASRWIAAAVAEYDALAARYESVSVTGLCIGATLALALAVQRPTVRSLALLSITLAYDGWAIPWFRFLLDWAYFTPLRHRWSYRERPPFGVKNEALRARIARAMREHALSEAGPSSIALASIYQANRLISTVKTQLPQVVTDCLMIHAVDDETSSPRNVALVAQGIGSPFTRKIFLDDSYHMISVDNERELVARETAMFVRESIARAAAATDGRGPPVLSKALARNLRRQAGAPSALAARSARPPARRAGPGLLVVPGQAAADPLAQSCAGPTATGASG